MSLYSSMAGTAFCSAVAAAAVYLELLLAVWCLRGQMNKDQLSITL